MQCAGIEERGRARAKAAALIEIVKTDDPVLAVAGFFEEESHGDAHPEKLGCFEAAGLLACLVYDEVAIVEGLNAEEVEVHVGRGVDGIGKRIEIVAEHLGSQALNCHARAEVALEGLTMSFTEPLDAVAHDFPIQHLLINVGEHDAGGEFCKIRIAFDECAGIEDDRTFEDVFIDFGRERTAEFAFDLKLVEVQI